MRPLTSWLSIFTSSSRWALPRRGGRRLIATICALLILLSAVVPAARAKEVRRIDRDRAQAILRSVFKVIEENYYDPEFKGVDLAARFEQAKA